MTKKAPWVLAAAAAGVVALVSAQATVIAGSLVPEPCIKSTLCKSLLELYEMEEGANSPRFGAYMGKLFEPTGVTVAQTTTKKTGSYAASFNGSTQYLWANGGASLPASTTFWFYPLALPGSGATKSIMGRNDSASPGPEVYLYNNAGTTKVCIQVRSIDLNQTVSVCNSTAISASTWYFVAAGFGENRNADGVITGSGLFLSLNAKAKEWSSNIGFVINPGDIQYRLGAGFADAGPGAAGANFFNGYIDQLAFFADELPDIKIALIFNGGAGRAYPFSTDQKGNVTTNVLPNNNGSSQDGNLPTPGGTCTDLRANDDSAIMTFGATGSPTYRAGHYVCAIDSPPVGVYNYVKVHVLGRRRSYGPCDTIWSTLTTSFQPTIKIGSNYYDGTATVVQPDLNTNTSGFDGATDGTCGNSVGAWQEVVTQWTANPATGAAWTYSDLQNLKIGAYMSIPYYQTFGGDMSLTYVYLEVNADVYQ